MARTASNPATNPAKQNRVKQLWAVFQMTRRFDSALIWWMLLAFAGTVALGVLLVVLFHLAPWLILPLFVISGVLLALIVMARRAERAAFAQVADQPGATALALQNLRGGWNVEEQPVAVNPRTQDMVFRAVGRPGVVLVTEGPTERVAKLADQQAKHARRVLGEGVPVTVYNAGNDEGQVPLIKLSRELTKAKPVLTKDQVSKVSVRLRALGGIKIPVPKGMDPANNRPDRRGMRGR